MAEGTFVPNYKIDQGTLDRLKGAGKPIRRFGEGFDKFAKMGKDMFEWAEEEGGVEELQKRVAENKSNREANRLQKATDKQTQALQDQLDAEKKAAEDALNNPNEYDPTLDDWQGDTSSSPWQQRSAEEPEISTPVSPISKPEVSTDKLISDNFGWGLKNMKERGNVFGKTAYAGFGEILEDKKSKFLEIQKNGGNTLAAIAELSEISSSLQTYKKTIESIADVDATVGWSKSLSPKNMYVIDAIANQTTSRPILDEDNRVNFAIVNPETGEEGSVSNQDLEAILEKNIKPVKRELDFSNNQQLIFNNAMKGGHFNFESALKKNKNDINEDNIQSYATDSWTNGLESFVEEAENDPRFTELDITAANVYEKAFEDPNNQYHDEVKEIIAEWVTNKQLAEHNRGVNALAESVAKDKEKSNPPPDVSVLRDKSKPSLRSSIAEAFGNAVARLTSSTKKA